MSCFAQTLILDPRITGVGRWAGKGTKNMPAKSVVLPEVAKHMSPEGQSHVPENVSQNLEPEAIFCTH